MADNEIKQTVTKVVYLSCFLGAWNSKSHPGVLTPEGILLLDLVVESESVGQMLGVLWSFPFDFFLELAFVLSSAFFASAFFASAFFASAFFA